MNYVLARESGVVYIVEWVPHERPSSRREMGVSKGSRFGRRWANGDRNSGKGDG